MAISDLGAYEFKRQLIYKALWFATKLDIIDQWYPSSKGCHNCHHIKSDLTLKDRVFKCDNCGLEIDRDFNASLRLEKAPDEVVKTLSPLSRGWDWLNPKQRLGRSCGRPFSMKQEADSLSFSCY